MLWVLDSTVLIDYLRGRPVVGRVASIKESGDVAATTAVNVEEIVRGLRTSEKESATQLFSGLLVLPVDAKAAWQAGEWRRTFAHRGVTLWQADCLIAATTLLSAGVLATANPRDFPMDGLHVQDWPIGG